MSRTGKGGSNFILIILRVVSINILKTIFGTLVLAVYECWKALEPTQTLSDKF